MTEQEDELEDTLAERDRSLKVAAETVKKGLECLQTHVRQMSENTETGRSKLQRARPSNTTRESILSEDSTCQKEQESPEENT